MMDPILVFVLLEEWVFDGTKEVCQAIFFIIQTEKTKDKTSI